MTTTPRVRRLAVALLLALGAATAHAGAYEDFFTAVRRDNGSAIADLLARGMDPNTRDPQGNLALTLALRDENLKAAEALMASPTLDVDAPNAAGETALMLAAIKGRTEWCRRLIERGAKVDRDGWTPLHYAASGPDADTVKLLLDRGAAIDARSPNGTTPLMMAARYGGQTSAELLLARGADRGRRNDLGLTAADFARGAGRDRLADQLAPPAK